MIGGFGPGPTGGPPDRIGGIVDIMSRFSRASTDQVLLVFPETDLPKKGERMIKVPFYGVLGEL